MMDTAAKPKRKRGAQAGNANAMRHGFYAAHFRTGEMTNLDSAFQKGLSDEITLLRVVMRRLFSMVDESSDALTIGELSNILATLGLTSTRLGSLLTKQRLLTGEDDTTAAAISNALAAVVKELGIHP